MDSSWLCREDGDRDRLVEMEVRLRPVRTITMALIGVSMVFSLGVLSLRVGLPALAGVAIVGSLFWLADKRIEHSPRPEFLVFGAWAGAESVIAACVIITGGPVSPGVAWLAIPIVTLSARFSTRGVIAGVAITVALLLGATLGVDAGAVVDEPTLLIAPLVLIVSIATLSTALMHSDLQYRSESVVDPLTGMLNRKALANRTVELAQQSAITGQPIGVIACDLDHFKEVNDSRGHAAGDAVLTDVAYRLRKRLRAFDLAYRIGGEEFVVLLPGSDLKQTRHYAEGLRQAVAAGTVGEGVEMTMSVGVSASASGTRFDYESVYAAADAALYEAKTSGRNSVHSRPEPALRADGSPAMPSLATS